MANRERSDVRFDADFRVDLKNIGGRGFIAWLFWRSAYQSKPVSLKNEVLMLQDRVRTFLFGQDISHF